MFELILFTAIIIVLTLYWVYVHRLPRHETSTKVHIVVVSIISILAFLNAYDSWVKLSFRNKDVVVKVLVRKINSVTVYEKEFKDQEIYSEEDFKIVDNFTISDFPRLNGEYRVVLRSDEQEKKEKYKIIVRLEKKEGGKFRPIIIGLNFTKDPDFMFSVINSISENVAIEAAVFTKE